MVGVVHPPRVQHEKMRKIKKIQNMRLTIGLLRDAWKTYPEDHAAIAGFPPGPPIFIGGTHRSGTTWFAGMLAEPGLWYIHEPFNPNKGLWKEDFTYARPGEVYSVIDRHMEKVFAGHFRGASNNPHTQHQLMPLRLFRPPIRRMMIKDPLACLLNGYLAARFDLQLLILFRHPAGFVSSIIRLGWPIGKFLRDFLTRRQLIDDHLGPYENLMRQYQNADDIRGATVLYGVLNTVQWRQIENNPEIRWRLFEDLCHDPLHSFKELFEEFCLPYTLDTRERHIKMCTRGSSDPNDYRVHAVARNSAAMADSWKRQLEADQVTEIRRIWDRFDIPLYRKECDWERT